MLIEKVPDKSEGVELFSLDLFIIQKLLLICRSRHVRILVLGTTTIKPQQLWFMHLSWCIIRISLMTVLLSESERNSRSFDHNEAFCLQGRMKPMSSGVCKRATTLCNEYSLAPGQSSMTTTARYPRRLYSQGFSSARAKRWARCYTTLVMSILSSGYITMGECGSFLASLQMAKTYRCLEVFDD